LPLVALIIGLTLALTGAFAGAQVAVQHGISVTKGCDSPTAIGNPYSCSYSIENITDEAHDTLTIDSLSDTVHAAPQTPKGAGDVKSGNFLGSAKLDSCSEAKEPCTPTTATCKALKGTGTRAEPWEGVEMCTLPFGSRINVESFSHYTVKVADFGLPEHKLTDTAELTWHDLCDDPAKTGDENCTPNPEPNVGAGGTSVILPIPSETETTIHDAAHNPVTAVEVGSTVHDLVTVTGKQVPEEPGQLAPTGNVNVDWFENGKCSGSPAASSGSIGPLVPGIPPVLVSTFDATGFPQVPKTAGEFAFKGNYEGAGPYAPSKGKCEPLKVVDANIHITPAKAINPVGAKHKLTCHINVNDGTGEVPAPDKTVCTVKVISGAATPASQPCETGSGSGSCVVEITSSTAGENEIQAETTVEVGGVKLTRTTGDKLHNDGENAHKAFADDSVTTKVLDAENHEITGTSVQAGTEVHDQATVTRTAGTPAAVPDPTGSVTFTLFSGTGCSGTELAKEAEVALAGGVATSKPFTTPSTAGSFSYLAHYNGDVNYPARDAGCEPFQTTSPFSPALTPGFWKNHRAATEALLKKGITLGNYKVSTFAQALAVFEAMKCSSPIDCLAGHELAAKLDLASGSNPSITPVIKEADALLIEVKYNGPGNFTPPTAAQKAKALELEEKIDAFTNA
jgi:hypothetical protein